MPPLESQTMKQVLQVMYKVYKTLPKGRIYTRFVIVISSARLESYVDFLSKALTVELNMMNGMMAVRSIQICNVQPTFSTVNFLSRDNLMSRDKTCQIDDLIL